MVTVGRRNWIAIAIILGVLAMFAGLGLVAKLTLGPVFGTSDPPKDLPAIWPTQGGTAVRHEVPMPTGEMVAALPRTTAGQVLCRAVPAQRWPEILGGPVLMEVSLTGSCHVVTATLDVTVDLNGSTTPLVRSEPITISGRSGYAEHSETGATLMLALTGNRPGTWVNPTLNIRLMKDFRDSERDLAGMAKAIAEGVIAATTAPGLSLPQDTESLSGIPPKAVPPTPRFGIVDGAYPMVSWQLCTQLAQELGVDIEKTKPSMRGDCQLQGDTFNASADYIETTAGKAEYPDRIGGRPAQFTKNYVQVKLTDDTDQAVRFHAFFARTQNDDRLHALVEKVLPPLLGR
ncbi:hypothetical protein ACFWY9_35065 [Amycolatopsis sp. NPDC059027]|uniref:hypothetical protein n=1 Tax=unclassified Amycolatopsis TaxID=2618356 RepID=UPI003670678D